MHERDHFVYELFFSCINALIGHNGNVNVSNCLSARSCQLYPWLIAIM